MGNPGKSSLVLALSAFLLASCGGSGGSQPGVSYPVETASAGGSYSGMSLGGIDPLSFTASKADVDLTGVADGLLIVNSTSQVGDDFTIQMTKGTLSALSTGMAALSVGEDAEEEAASQFHQYLREMEAVMRDSGEFTPASQTGLAALTVDPEVGDTRSFRVLNSINSITSYAEVTGELRMATDNLYIYVDQDGSDNISDEDLETLAHNFEDIAIPREREIMGRESDINFDGHISIVMTCTVNRMAASGGIVTGFFFPGDLYQRSSVNNASNAQEVFYTLLPDPAGDCGTPISAQFAVQNILPGVLAHEYQHMNSFNQHVFKKAGSTEESWLNEGLSHFFEDLTGFGNENPSRIKLFLAQPSKTPLIPATSPTLAERGACLTFLRYLYEQSPDGDAFLSGLYSSNRTGVANLEAAFNGNESGFQTFPEFVNRWSIALSLSGTGVTSDSRYVFAERSENPETGNKTGICLHCDAQDGRGTVLDGPVMTPVTAFPVVSAVKGTATQFYRLKSPSDESVQVQVSGAPDLTGALVRFE